MEGNDHSQCQCQDFPESRTKAFFKPIALKNRKLTMFPYGFVAIYRNSNKL